MLRIARRAVLVALSVAASAGLGLAGAPSALAHDERPTRELSGTGSVPVHRSTGPTLLVCKTDAADFATRIAAFPEPLKRTNEALWQACQRSGYRHLQAAVDAVDRPGMTIKLLPGLYREEPSLAPATGPCAGLTGIRRSELYRYEVLTLAQQTACPHNQNLVAIIDKKDLQVEGTGAAPTDVVVDAQYRKLNTIRADNADGIYFRNLTAQRSQFNAFYVMETDGFVIDSAVGRWNDEYGFLTFAVDHGLYTRDEGYGNGDSAFYPGAASNINKDRGYDVPRYAVEIRDSYAHDNMLGYSGTAGDSVWVHDNVFTDNSTGISTDSAFPDHPGMPQNHSTFERNVIANNNHDYYGYFGDGTCQKPYAERGYERGVVCPVVGVPVGAGVINPGGNYNTWKGNYVYGNRYAGFLTSFVPGFVRNDTSLVAQFDTSHHNRYLANHMGVSEKGVASPNGVDYWWDGQGVASCWTTAGDSVDVGSNIGALSRCGPDSRPTPLTAARWFGEPLATLKMYACSGYNLQEHEMPVDCDWWGSHGATGLQRIEVRWAVVEGVLLLLVGAVTLLRRGPRSRLALTGLALLGAGSAGVVAGTWLMDGRLLGLALVGAGIGWLLLGWALRRHGRRGFGWLTLLLGVLALLDGIDHAVVPVPFLPVSPALVRLLLEVVWLLWGLASAVRPRPAPQTARDVAPAPAAGASLGVGSRRDEAP